MKANDFENRFNNGESIIPYADMSHASRLNKVKRVNVDFPLWMLEDLDKEANRLGVTRQSLVKVWIADCLAQKVLS